MLFCSVGVNFEEAMIPFHYQEEEESEEAVTATSVEESTSKNTGKLTSAKKEVYKTDKPFVSKKEVMTLDHAASKFPSFILSSINNQNKAHMLKEVNNYPRVEKDLYATNTSGYILDLHNLEYSDYIGFAFVYQ